LCGNIVRMYELKKSPKFGAEATRRSENAASRFISKDIAAVLVRSVGVDVGGHTVLWRHCHDGVLFWHSGVISSQAHFIGFIHAHSVTTSHWCLSLRDFIARLNFLNFLSHWWLCVRVLICYFFNLHTLLRSSWSSTPALLLDALFTSDNHLCGLLLLFYGLVVPSILLIGVVAGIKVCEGRRCVVLLLSHAK